MPRVIKRPLALRDIAEIWDFIANDSETMGDAFVDLVDGKLLTLSHRPSMGRGREDLAPQLRSFPVGRYLIFYLPLPDGVDVVRILHSARDLEAIFHDDDENIEVPAENPDPSVG